MNNKEKFIDALLSNNKLSPKVVESISDKDQYDILYSIFKSPYPTSDIVRNRVKLYMDNLLSENNEIQESPELELMVFRKLSKKYGRPKSIKTENQLILDFWKNQPWGATSKRYN